LFRFCGCKGTNNFLNDKIFLENGFDAFISKPIDIRQMNSVLNKYVRDAHPEENTNEIVASTTIAPAVGKVDKSLLNIFKKDARNAIITLTETAKDDNMLLFATTAHAMKSACANIGETALSELARSLEFAAKDNNKAFVDGHFEELITGLNKIIGEDDCTPEVEADDTELLTSELAKIKTACAVYDSAAARESLALLKEKQWTRATTEFVDEIDDMVRCSDFEEAIAKIEELL